MSFTTRILQPLTLAGALLSPVAASAQNTTPSENQTAAPATNSPQTPIINENWLTRTPPNPTHAQYPFRAITIGVGGFIPLADPDQSGGQIDFQLNPVQNRWATVRMITPRWGWLPDKFQGSPVPISFTPYFQMRANREAASASLGALAHFFPPQVLSLYVGAAATLDLHYPIGNDPLSLDVGGDAIAGFQFRLARGYSLALQLDIPFIRHTVEGTDRTNMAARGSVIFRF